MTTEEEKVLRLFETRVRQLILKLDEVAAENRELYAMLDERDHEIKELRQQVDNITQQHANLKLAKMIEITSAEAEGAQRRLAKLIREVDKCIALLNV